MVTLVVSSCLLVALSEAGFSFVKAHGDRFWDGTVGKKDVELNDKVPGRVV